MREKHQKAFPLIFDKCITVIPSTKPMQERESGQRGDDMGVVPRKWSSNLNRRG